MQPAPRSCILYPNSDVRALIVDGWLQAGFFGFAYRLAHLSTTRSVVLVGTVLVFYLV